MPDHSSRLPPEDLDHVLTHTRELWAEARGQSFFITGGTGFFGMWLLESFAHANDLLCLNARVTVLTRDPDAFVRRAPHLATRTDLTLVQGDIRTFEFPAGQFSHIIHAATEVSAKVHNESSHDMLDVTIGGTRRLLDFAAQCGVKKLMFISSGAVYGRQPHELTHMPEDYPGAPDPLLSSSAYGVGKRVSEHLCAVHALRHGYESKIARCFAFVGPYLPLDAHFAVGNFIRDALEGRPIQVNGDGTALRSYLYSSDLAIWLWTIFYRGSSGRAYNVGSPSALSIFELAGMVGDLCDVSSQVKVECKAGVDAKPVRYVPDTSRAASELGVGVKISLPSALKKTFLWYQLLK